MTHRQIAIRVGLVVLALAAAVGVDLLIGYPVPGRMAVVALGSSFVLVLGAKWLAGAFLQQPVGTRVGELGNPADDVSDDWIDRDRSRDRSDAAPHAVSHQPGEADRG